MTIYVIIGTAVAIVLFAVIVFAVSGPKGDAP